VASAGSDGTGSPGYHADALRAGILAEARRLPTGAGRDAQVGQRDFRRNGIYAMAASDDPAVLGKEVGLASSLRWAKYLPLSIHAR